jgi:hypothetical protein
MLTSKGTTWDQDIGTRAGANGYVIKPYRAKDLLWRISDVLNIPPPVEADKPRLSRLPQHWQSPPVYPVQHSDYADIGRRMAEIRKMRGKTLYNAEMESGVRWDFIQAMERGYYLSIPYHQRQAIFQSYSRYLGINLPEFSLPPDLYLPSSSRRFQLKLPGCMLPTAGALLALLLAFSAILFYHGII